MVPDRDTCIFVAGAGGLAGGAILRRLRAEGFADLIAPGSAELDLCNQAAVRAWFATRRPECVILAAARVGGIHANGASPADFLGDNLSIALHTIQAAAQNGCRRLLFLGSSCIYPRMAPQPMREDSLLTGPLEPTNQWYAVAKIAGLKLCEAVRRQRGLMFHSAMPTNLYGPGDNYHRMDSHVLPALIRRLHEAREAAAPSVTIWGTGTPRREFLHADDLADAVMTLLQAPDPPDLVNIGAGEDIAIMDLARLVAEVVGYDGAIETDPSRPDGPPRKLLDVSRMRALGWRARIGLRTGLERAYASFLDEMAAGTARL